MGNVRDVRDKTDFKLKNEGVLWTYDPPSR